MQTQSHIQASYWKMSFQAEYYTWAALRGLPLPGNDPISGCKRAGFSRGESRSAYIAMARYWVAQARAYRERMTQAYSDVSVNHLYA